MYSSWTAFHQRYGRYPAQDSPDPEEAQLAKTGNPVVTRLASLWKLEEPPMTLEQLLALAPNLHLPPAASYTFPTFQGTKGLLLTPPAELPPELQGLWMDFGNNRLRIGEVPFDVRDMGGVPAGVWTLKKPICTRDEMMDLVDNRFNMFQDWRALEADEYARQLLMAEFQSSKKNWFIPWYMMQMVSDRDDQAHDLKLPFRQRVLSFVVKWRLYFRPRLLACGSWAVVPDRPPKLLFDEESDVWEEYMSDVAQRWIAERPAHVPVFTISDFYTHPYTFQQADALRTILQLNAIYREKTGRGHTKMDRIAVLKEELRRQLAPLSDQPRFFSFTNNNILINWPGHGGVQTRIPWKYLCQANSRDNPDAAQYLGVIQRLHTHFKSR